MNAKRRILIVDDEVGFTRLLRLNLGCTGRYVVGVENDARNALPTAREFDPDLILLDVMMPGQDGGDIAAQLQRDPRTRDVPIVFVTAAVKREEIRSHQGRIGGAPFIGKPVELSELIRCIDQQLESRTLAGGPPLTGWKGHGPPTDQPGARP